MKLTELFKIDTIFIVQLGILLLLFFSLYAPVFPDLFSDWFRHGDYYHSDNSHCILVPFISLYFIWDRRKQILLHEIRSSKVGFFIFIISTIIYLMGYAGGIYIAIRLAMIFSLIGLLYYILGEKVIKSILFPLVFLIFMIPVPYSILRLISLPLQTIITIAAAFIIGDVLSIPVFREGNMLHFTLTSLEVADVCSGIRSLTSYIMLGSIFAYISKGSKKIKFILVFMSIPLAMVINLLRVAGTGVLAHYYGRQVAVGFMHELSGILVFILGLMAMALLWKFLGWFEQRLNKVDS
ncbi:MAG: exosortase/archaeosortase family protein [Pseudomonadota bacterium]